MQALKGKVALVTGAGSGIGRATARALAEAGAELWLVGRRSEALEETAGTLAGARVHPADLTRDAEIDRLADALRRASGRLDVLVHAAAELRRGRLPEAPLDDLDAQLATNLRAPLALSRALLDLLVEARGDLVFVGSSVVRAVPAGFAGYSASKRALAALAEGLRDELNPRGVRVLAIHPGRTATPLQERLHREDGEDYRPEALLQPEDVAACVLHAVALPATAEVTDIHLRPRIKPPG